MVGTECVLPDLSAEALTLSIAVLEMGTLRKQLRLTKVIRVGPCSDRISFLIRDPGSVAVCKPERLSLETGHPGTLIRHFFPASTIVRKYVSLV